MGQLRVMMWKNWLLKRRQPVSSLAEICLPMLFMAILCALRQLATVEDRPTELFANTSSTDIPISQSADNLNPAVMALNLARNEGKNGTVNISLVEPPFSPLPGTPLPGIDMLAASNRRFWDLGLMVTTPQGAGGTPKVDVPPTTELLLLLLQLSMNRPSPTLRQMLIASAAFNTSISVVYDADDAKLHNVTECMREQVNASLQKLHEDGDAVDAILSNEVQTLCKYAGALMHSPSDCVKAASELRTSLATLVSNGAFDRVFEWGKYKTEDDFESFVTRDGYDKAGVRKVGAAIVFDAGPGTEWDENASHYSALSYAIRLNFTNRAQEQGSNNPFAPQAAPVVCFTQNGCGERSVPPTKFSALNTKSKDVDKQCEQFFPRGICSQLSYANSGFLTLQALVDACAIGSADQRAMHDAFNVSGPHRVASTLMPIPKYRTDNFMKVIKKFLALFYMLSFLYPVSRLIRALVLEKERRIKEGMRMMGLSDTVFYSSWFISSALQFLLMSVLMTLVAANGGSNAVFTYSKRFFVFLYFFMFSLSIIALCFLISVFFSRSKTAATLGTMFFFAAYFPYNAVQDPNISQHTKVMASLLSPTAFALGTDVFADFEGGEIGVRRANIHTVTSNFSYSACVGMMFFDFLLYLALAWYFDNVLPSEFGTRRPCCFCCCCCSGDSGQDNDVGAGRTAAPRPVMGVTSGAADSDLSERLLPAKSHSLHLDIATGVLSTVGPDGESMPAPPEAPSPVVEPVSRDLQQQEETDAHRCMQLQGLRRVFKTTGADRIAVHGLNLSVYNGQITALLGHNGAGKSTTINMLTGLVPPTAGDALVAGKRVSCDMQKIRKSMGVCPQHDILFDELTVREHLLLFAIFKGMPRKDASAEVDRFIAGVGLTEKKHTQSRALSGGMKRKLSVAIALIGGSDVVVLDEPTSGMDPYSRRSTWSLLQNAKKGKVVLLTTHFMDEADILGDRIAIMAEGQLRCCGSSLFLKNRYGVGYTLTIVRLDHRGEESVKALASLVQSHVTEAQMLSNVGGELSFRLPLEAVASFAPLFRELDTAIAARDAALAISSYGISVTTLEEVFMRVGEGTDDDAAQAHLRQLRANKSSQGGADDEAASATAAADSNADEGESLLGTAGADGFGRGTGGQVLRTAFYSKSAGRVKERRVFARHVYALLVKRWINAKRDKKLMCFQLVIPVVFVIFGLLLLKLPHTFDQPALIIDASTFNPKFSPPSNNPVPVNGSLLSSVNTSFIADGTGGTCRDYEASVPKQYEFECNSSRWASALPESVSMSAYLLSTMGANASSRYGAVLYNETPGITSELQYMVMTNASAVHGVPLYINEVNSARLRSATQKPNAHITVTSHPMPLTYRQNQAVQGLAALAASFMIVISFSFIPASYAIFVVKEREVKAKHQQLISGVSLPAFWVATYIFDMLSYLVPSGFTILAVLAFGVDAYTKGAGLYGTVALFLLYGPAVAGFTYCISFVFKSHSTAQNLVLFLNFLTGLILALVSYVLSNLDSTRDLNTHYLKYVYRLFPSFNLADGLQVLAFCNGDSCITFQNGQLLSKAPWDWDVIGCNVTFLGVEAIIYFAISLGIEFALTMPKVWKCLYSVADPETEADGADEDEDVARERARVSRGDARSEVIVLNGLRKVYPPATGTCLGVGGGAAKVAVRNLSFGIPRGECFGFLGINGAGKTTTLAMLSGEFPASRGAATIAGFDVESDQTQIRREIGYCPQFDALFELLTPREHLELYARIKGVDEAQLPAVVGEKLRQMDLTDFQDKVAGSLSGGNKRKLSVAIAMIGEPTIVFLDEPSTGMDPVARRFMWDVIARLSTRQGRCSIMLTTHSMEEAEALCTRIGIMVNGALQCLGSAQHLKSRFGRGYELDVKSALPTSDEMKELGARAAEAGALQEAHDGDHAVIYAGENGSALAPLLETLGCSQYASEISATGTGHEIFAAAQADGFVRAAAFFEWVVAEKRRLKIDAFMRSTFPSSTLVEQATAHSMRYKVDQTEKRETQGQEHDSITLAHMFDSIEQCKNDLGITEYSVGQTTLEQIFNQFASSQLNPENA